MADQTPPRPEADRPPGSALRTLLESLAREADELSRQLDKIADEAFIETAPNWPSDSVAEAASRAYGLYRAVVVGSADPERRGRIQVRVPEVLGEATVWAEGCVPPGGESTGPNLEAIVWVAFEAGDPARPVWLGVRPERA